MCIRDRDNTEGGAAETVYTSLADVDFSHWSQRNYEYLKLSLEGAPKMCIRDSNGFVDGDVTLTWQDLTFAMDRGRRFSLDEHEVNDTNFAVSYTHLDVYKRQALH